MITKAKKILSEVFGYSEFRPMQREVIENVLQGRDTLAIMPTGGGKSLCYQIPALIFDGLTIVVSPLISLMKDQVEQLKENGVNAVYLNSSLSVKEYRTNVEKVRNNSVKLLYVAPETLLLDKTLELLSELKISLITIDEAHCISEWGHDFRPVYRKIAPLRDRFPEAVIIALTATATPRVQQDIANNLRLKTNDRFVASFDRKNLYLQIWQKAAPDKQVVAFLNKHKNESGIIYCFSRNQVDSLAELLYSKGFSVRPYHAGLSDNERKTNQELFIKDDVQIIVATVAFGMGINKPNVRFVIHYDLPKNIESYYQEIGRAGRDGLRANCILLFSYNDIRKINYFIDQKDEKDRAVAKQHLKSLINYAESFKCRRIPLLSYFGEKYEADNCGMCDNCNREAADNVDLTLEAQKFMSCMVRTKQLFDAEYIIDNLVGSDRQEIFENGHDKLTTYGVGVEHSKHEWKEIFKQLLKKGLVIEDETDNSLKCTHKGVEVLKGQRTFEGKLDKIKDDGDFARYDSEIKDKELFEILWKERKRLADRNGIPPYTVLPDKSLIEMAEKYPMKATEMLQIHGMNATKFNKYGNPFLRVIRIHCKENNIQKNEDNSAKVDLDNPKLMFFEKVALAYNSGMNLDEIMERFNLKLENLIKQLQKYNDQVEDIDPYRLMEKVNLSEEMIDNIYRLFEEKGTAYLRPVYNELNGDVDLITLNILKLNYLHEKDFVKK